MVSTTKCRKPGSSPATINYQECGLPPRRTGFAALPSGVDVEGEAVRILDGQAFAGCQRPGAQALGFRGAINYHAPKRELLCRKYQWPRACTPLDGYSLRTAFGRFSFV
jgi:hypothetical protein